MQSHATADSLTLQHRSFAIGGMESWHSNESNILHRVGKTSSLISRPCQDVTFEGYKICDKGSSLQNATISIQTKILRHKVQR